MKLDVTDLRYVSNDEFRVLTAVEMGSKNHEVVPTILISKIAGLRSGGVNKILGSLAKRNLIAKVQNTKYDGYRLTYGGYDYLAMRALSKRDSMYSVGNQIGVGKESDIYVVADTEGKQMVLKLHRLGRISFRAIKEKRDYLGKRKSASWMYMSRLAAQKEWAFMKVLHEHGFPVPTPIDQARHCILMEYIDAFPLRQIAEIPSPGKLYSQLMDLIVGFAHAGLIHGDYNEFNILIHRTTGEPVVIDFPQMVSTSHENAEWYFNRDVECIRGFFRRRFRYESVLYPRFKATMKEGDEPFRLDVVVAASGFSKKEMRTLEEYMESVKEGNEGQEDPEMEEEAEGRSQAGLKSDDIVNMAIASPSPPGTPSICRNSLSDDDDDDDDDDDSASTSEHSDEEPRVPPSRSLAPSPTDSLVARAATLSLNPDTLPDDEILIKNESESEEPMASPGLVAPATTDNSGSSIHRRTTQISIKERVASDIVRQHARQGKYHSKRRAHRIGRPKGSKAKQDTRIKLDRNSLWE